MRGRSCSCASASKARASRPARRASDRWAAGRPCEGPGSGQVPKAGTEGSSDLARWMVRGVRWVPVGSERIPQPAPSFWALVSLAPLEGEGASEGASGKPMAEQWFADGTGLTGTFFLNL
jgi:hypothetical protein